MMPQERKTPETEIPRLPGLKRRTSLDMTLTVTITGNCR